VAALDRARDGGGVAEVLTYGLYQAVTGAAVPSQVKVQSAECRGQNGRGNRHVGAECARRCRARSEFKSQNARVKAADRRRAVSDYTTEDSHDRLCDCWTWCRRR